MIQVHGYCEDDYCERCEDYDLLLRMASQNIFGFNLQENLLSYEIRTSHIPYRYRVNEGIVRYKGFRELGLLPNALPYVIKPLIAGIIPITLLNRYKKNRFYSDVIS